MVSHKEKKQALAMIYGNQRIIIKPRLNRSLVESNRKTEYNNKALDIQTSLCHTSIEEQNKVLSNRPKSSQNFIYKPHDPKTQIRPSTKQKHEGKERLLSIQNNKLSMLNAQQLAKTANVYGKRSRIPRKVQMKIIKKVTDLPVVNNVLVDSSKNT